MNGQRRTRLPSGNNRPAHGQDDCRSVWHDHISALVLSEVLAMVSLVAGHANLAALEVYWLRCGISGELSGDPSLANQQTLMIAKGPMAFVGDFMDKRRLHLRDRICYC